MSTATFAMDVRASQAPVIAVRANTAFVIAPRANPTLVIPAKAGIPPRAGRSDGPCRVRGSVSRVDPRFRGDDDILGVPAATPGSRP